MPLTETLFFVSLSTGLAVGFGHCIGMCGPIVVSLSLGLAGSSPWIPQVLYHAGRVMTYVVLGAIFGATGSVVQVTAGLAGFQRGVRIFAGVLIIVMGFVTGGWLPKGRFLEGGDASKSWISRGFGRLSRTRKTAAFFPLGLLLGLLPCGPVYTLLAGAARAGMESATMQGGMISGMGMMAAFGTGTAMPLILVARLTSVPWLKSKVWIYRSGSLIMIGMGVYFLAKALSP